MVSVTIGAKSLDPNISYRAFKPMEVQTEEKVHFLIENLREEVLKESDGQRIKKIRKLKKLIKVSLSVLAATANLSPRALAATTTAGVDKITPALMMKWGLTVALISVSAGVAISMTMLTIAGVYRMFRKRIEADEWSQDIIRGLVQVLISVPTVYLLYFIAQMLFSHLSFLKAAF